MKKFLKLCQKIFAVMTRADKVLILLLILFSVSLSLIFVKKSQATQVDIFWHNQLYGQYSLQEPRNIELKKGVHIEIKNGKARMLESDCHNQLCVKQGWNNKNPIICLPDTISIIFKTKDKMLLTQ